VLSFDVEEHDRIEAAVGLEISPAMKRCYRGRMGWSIRWLLSELEKRGVRATFFIIGEVAQRVPNLVRRIHRAGHELASHGWDHRRILSQSREVFLEDVRRSRDVLEQISGEAVVGYRAPTFSIVRSTAWAIGALAELGMEYDSSVQPIWHDRYGVPDAPRQPYIVRVGGSQLLELPMATARVCGVNLPVGGGGYFRLLPLWITERALAWSRSSDQTTAPTFYFHPWEFDADQPRLPLGRLNRFRTYVGIKGNRERFKAFLDHYPFQRAIDLKKALSHCLSRLPIFDLAESAGGLYARPDRVDATNLCVQTTYLHSPTSG